MVHAARAVSPQGGLRARALAACAVVALACGGPPPCTSSLGCGEGRVCGLDGRCGPLETPSGARFAASSWMDARDWGLATRDARPLADALVVGGSSGSEALLAFGPLPGGSRILRALLVLHPLEPDAHVGAPGELLVEQVEPFRGGRMPARPSAAPASFAAARTALARGPARPVRIDLTSAARAAAERGDRTLYVLVRLEGGDPAGASFASPWSTSDQSRPRLELMLH